MRVPGKGQYAKPSDLIGKTIGTRFTSLAEDYFAALEKEVDPAIATVVGMGARRKLNIKVVGFNDSVEAACIIGIVDGIVDLVGKSFLGKVDHIS